MDQSLLVRFVRDYPFQPATAVWRSVEIDCVARLPWPAGRGLDLGCGDGLLTRIVFEHVGRREVVGLDPDSSEVELARLANVYTRIHLAPGDAIPESDNSFDWVLSNSVLEHIDNVQPVLADAARVLRHGGDFIFTVPSIGFHQALRGPILPWVARSNYLKDVDGRLAHRYYWGLERWRQALGEHGLDIIESVQYLTQAQVRRWETVSRCTAGVLHTLWGKRVQPIEIQRKLGMRGARRLPASAAWLLGSLLALGISGDQQPADAPFGGLLIRARKSGQ